MPALVSKFIHSSPKLIPDCILTILTLVWYVWKWLCSCREDSLHFNWSKCASHTTGAPPFVLCLSWPFFLSWRAFPLVSSSRTLQDIFERSVVSFLQWGIVFLLDFFALSREGSSWCLLSCHFRVKRVQNYASICTHSSPVILWKVLSTWKRLQCVEGAAEKSNSAESLAILRPTQITSQTFQSFICLATFSWIKARYEVFCRAGVFTSFASYSTRSLKPARGSRVTIWHFRRTFWLFMELSREAHRLRK